MEPEGIRRYKITAIPNTQRSNLLGVIKNQKLGINMKEGTFL